jgi:outer membrane protein, heavy metal efflux system
MFGRMKATLRTLAALALYMALATTVPGAAAAATEPASAEPPVLDFGDRLELVELIEAVLVRNPDVASAEAARRAVVARIAQADSLDDPMVSYSLSPLTLGSSSSRFGQELRLSQRLPWPGTLSLKRHVAEAEASAAAQQVQEVRFRLAALAESLFVEYWRISRSRWAVEDHVRLLEEMKDVATSRYAAGLAPQQAPLRAEVEAAHVHHDLIELAAGRERVTARLNALLHQPIETALPPPEDLPEPGVLEASAEHSHSIPASASERPELKAMRDTLAARRLSLKLQERSRYPELELMTSYESLWDVPSQRWRVGVGVTLPLWRKRIRAGIEEAQAELEASEAELASRQDSARMEVAVATATLTESIEEVELYRDRVLPASRDQVAAARAAFTAGTADMLTAIDAARSLRIAELEYYRAMADCATARTELDRALGNWPTAAAPASGAEKKREEGQ